MKSKGCHGVKMEKNLSQVFLKKFLNYSSSLSL